MAAVMPLLGALLTVAACYALGSIVLARLNIELAADEKLPLGFVSGAAILHLAVFAVLTLHIAYSPVLLAVLLSPSAAAMWIKSWRLPPSKREISLTSIAKLARLVFVGAAGIFTILYFFNAWAPENSPDGVGYHLPLMARYLQAHGFQPVPTDFYSTLSEGVELVFLPAFAIGGGSAAALVHFAFLIALALAIRAYGRRCGHTLAGEAAALLVYLSPVAGVVGTSAYVDVATTAIVFVTFYWTRIWDDDRRRGVLICVGLLSGYCYAAKYTAAVMAVYVAGYVLWRSKNIKLFGFVCAWMLVMAAPWMVKDWIYVDNPIAPFGNALFRNPYIHIEFERGWSLFLQTYGIASRWKLPWDALVDGRVTQTPLGPVFLLLPLSLLSLRKQLGRQVLLPAVLLFVPYFANVGSRFLLPSLPFFSLALALVFEDVQVALLLLVLVHGLSSWPPYLRRHTHALWALQHVPVRAALRIESEEHYLRQSGNYHAARLIERSVPPGEKVFAPTGLSNFYSHREILGDYQGALNEQLADILAAGWSEISQPTRELSFRFPVHQLRRIRVVQTATVPQDEEWSVHEIRLFHDNMEIRSTGNWRFRSFPNPWDVHYAFDNLDATRWRSWETATPGMYIDVEFASPIAVDRVAIETSVDNPHVKLRLEEMIAENKWALLSELPEQLVLKPSLSQRRAAAIEFQAHGIRYLFVSDSDKDHGGPLYATDPESWDFTPIDHADGATVYRIGR
jgi:hypothetical protein